MATVANLIVAQLQAGIFFDRSRGVYVTRDGKTITEAALRRVSRSYLQGETKAALREMTERMFAGKMPLPDWQSAFAKTIKDAHIVNLQIGRGGKAATTFSDYGRAGRMLRDEYQALSRFASEIAQGKLSEAQIQARADLYAQSCQKAFWAGRTAAKTDAGADQERRVLHPAEHCDDCIGYAAMGWQPIGTLPEPGDGSVCGSNCKCRKEYTYTQRLQPELTPEAVGLSRQTPAVSSRDASRG